MINYIVADHFYFDTDNYRNLIDKCKLLDIGLFEKGKKENIVFY